MSEPYYVDDTGGGAGTDGTSVTIFGSVGATGTTGPRGAKWFTGSGAPGTVSGAVAGDFYLDTTPGDGHLWVWGGSSFTDVGNVRGPTGQTGSQGPTGPTGATGSSYDRCGRLSPDDLIPPWGCVKPREHEGDHEDRDGRTWAQIEGWVKA